MDCLERLDEFLRLEILRHAHEALRESRQEVAVGTFDDFVGFGVAYQCEAYFGSYAFVEVLEFIQVELRAIARDGLSRYPVAPDMMVFHLNF